MLGLSVGEVVFVLIVACLVFGWSWLPRIGERVGSFVHGVRGGLRDDDPGIVVKQADEKAPNSPKS